MPHSSTLAATISGGEILDSVEPVHEAEAIAIGTAIPIFTARHAEAEGILGPWVSAKRMAALLDVDLAHLRAAQNTGLIPNKHPFELEEAKHIYIDWPQTRGLLRAGVRVDRLLPAGSNPPTARLEVPDAPGECLTNKAAAALAGVNSSVIVAANNAHIIHPVPKVKKKGSPSARYGSKCVCWAGNLLG